jgi:glutamate carboxypeptidase
MSLLSVFDFGERTEALVSLLRRLVEIESPSTNKAAVDGLGAVLADELRRLGAIVTIDKQSRAGDNLIAQWGVGQAEGLLILCHTDTVHDLGALARNPCREANGKLYGPGAVDMKASLAMTLVALAALKEKRQWPPRPITALFTSDEEIGSDGSRALIEKLARESALVLCLEPCLADGSLKTWRKGVGDFEIIARGKATHAGADHESGRNAIEEVAHHILAIQQLTDYAHGTTLNVGVVHGGTRSNVVPEEARIHVDMRVKTPEEAERITRWMQALKPVMPGVTLEVTGGLNRPPMPHNDTMKVTFKKAQAIAANLGLKIGEGGTGGGSDANFVAPLGVPVLDGLGALGNGAHSEREHVVIASLPERTALLAGIISEW